MIHELKTWPEYYEFIESGEKTFEVRKNDRNYQVGDTLILQEWSDINGYTGRDSHQKVTYVMTGGKWGLAEGNVILGISPLGVKSPSSSTPSPMSPTSMSESAEKDSTIIRGVVIKHEPAPETYGGVAVHTAIGNFAVARLHQKEAREKIGHKVFVKPIPDFYRTVEIISWDAKPESAEEAAKEYANDHTSKLREIKDQLFSEFDEGITMWDVLYAAHLAGHNRAKGKGDIRGLYNKWCKETKRNGSVLIGSMNEFFDYLDQHTQPSPDAEVFRNEVLANDESELEKVIIQIRMLDNLDAIDILRQLVSAKALETYKQQKQ